MDIVITWVDGDDPVHREKRAKYSGVKDTQREDIAAPTRFRSVGEIYYCVRSVLKFAPFVENIYIVTDQQDPKINHPKVKIVDHREIFRGYEEYLPTFNSISIEAMLWRIEGLSEKYVYINDDFMLLNQFSPEDWFIGDKAVVWGKWDNLPLQRLVSALRPNHFGFKDSLANAALAGGNRWKYWHLGHTPYTMLRSTMERYYDAHPEQLIENIRHRFRNPAQHNPQALFGVLAVSSGEGIAHPVKDMLFMKPVGRGDNYVARKIEYAQKHQPLMVCVESLDLATEADQRQITEWLKEILNDNE